jgi:hypothetical protein
MFKGVPYFCYSHLLALITVAPVVTGPAPAFDPLLPPLHPLYLERVLAAADVARAQQLIALVCLVRPWLMRPSRKALCCGIAGHGGAPFVARVAQVVVGTCYEMGTCCKRTSKFGVPVMLTGSLTAPCISQIEIMPCTASCMACCL